MKKTRRISGVLQLVLLLVFLSGCKRQAGNDASSTEKSIGSCTFSIECAMIQDNLARLAKGKEELVPEDGIILAKETVDLYEGDAVFDILQRETRARNMHLEYSFTKVYDSCYIEGIQNLYEFDCGELSGWMYCVNDVYPNYGCSQYEVQPGDNIEWHYTCDLGRDLGETIEKE